MKYTRRMVLVPEEFMDMLERKETIQTLPVTKKMIRLDRKMDGILDDPSKSEDVKVAQYNQNLQQFLDMQEKKRQFVPTVKIYQEKTTSPATLPSPAPPQPPQPTLNNQVETAQSSREHHPLPESEILDSIPKNSRSLARSMINRLKANRDQVTWNHKGEIVIDGNAVSGSNITDLIIDQLNSRKNFDPTGWRQFTESLDKINIPKHLMRNEKRLSYLSPPSNPKTPGSSLASKNYAFPPTPPTTPKTSKPRASMRPIKQKRFSENWITH